MRLRPLKSEMNFVFKWSTTVQAVLRMRLRFKQTNFQMTELKTKCASPLRHYIVLFGEFQVAQATGAQKS